jgi:ferredoxin
MHTCNGMRACYWCRLAAAELWEALDSGKANTAVKLLRETEFPRELACRRNAERSSYPMHAAVSGNMPEVALELANPSRYAGVFTQRDSSGYSSPIFSVLLSSVAQL